MVANLEVTPAQGDIDRLAKELSRGAELLRRLEVAVTQQQPGGPVQGQFQVG